MRLLSLEQAADFIENSNIEKSHDVGHAIIHTGTSESGSRFVLVNNHYGETVLSESM